MSGGKINGEDLMNPLVLFGQADIVVKLVILGLLIASIGTWAIIVGHSWRLRREMKASEAFERDLWEAKDIDAFHDKHEKSDIPGAKLFIAGIGEWRRSTAAKTIDREGTRSRLMGAMNASAAGEIDRLSDRLNILATVGSVAPFVGLFGTVWGIMRAFTGIASANNTSLAVVAPGIAEALFATAIGLFAAIPAVIAYNRFSHGINRIEASLNRFADGFHTTLSRQLDGSR